MLSLRLRGGDSEESVLRVRFLLDFLWPFFFRFARDFLSSELEDEDEEDEDEELEDTSSADDVAADLDLRPVSAVCSIHGYSPGVTDWCVIDGPGISTTKSE